MITNRSRQWTVALTIVYGCLLQYWMFFAFGRDARVADGYRYNVVPFSTIEHFVHIAGRFRRAAAFNLLGNIIMFVPFGLLLPLTKRLHPLVWTLLFAAGITSLELLQLATKRGMFDVDDIILNTGGFLIGYLVLLVTRPQLFSK
ncbi:VanZ like protein [Paenibacillus cellulosilyticus]|uniref:VanZ like protein n=1 Tax=Paenibacillus cellulosilyticus TaxID=375489 RepID=A0A2V2YPW2_9BACL|nr:VanZ family protein [Paenibacillus cellulosilyticus]PWV98475.1 VanZ like protein [Paenibacillus cellulosilyticus]QKS43315.1 VanZ family protein [Paenibacillus cellulosilyticus]